MSTWVGALQPELRRGESIANLARVRAAMDRWSASWLAEARHASQLAVITKTLGRLCDRVQTVADCIGTDQSAHRAWRQLDFDVAFVERLWGYYAERLDARRPTSAQAGLLHAADDVIWSCYDLVEALSSGGPSPPLPLAYLEPTYSAHAPPRTTLVGGRPLDAALRTCIDAMPVPLIAVPTSVLDAPWWLAVLAHEAGHHVQFDLEPKQALVGRVGDALEAIGGARWQAWRFELFADGFAIATLGPEANQVIAAMEWGAIEELAIDRGAYPPVLVRLALASELAVALGFPDDGWGAAAWRASLEPLPPATRATVGADLDRVAAGAQALAALMVGPHSLATAPRRTTAAECAPDSNEQRAYAAVLGGSARGLAPHRRKPRWAAVAAFRAFRTGAVAASELRPRTMALLQQVRDTTTTRGPSQLAIDTDTSDATIWASLSHARAAEAP